jgi:phosphate acetyltransferase
MRTEQIENTTYPEIRIGQQVSLSRTLTEDDIRAFAAVSGDTNPAHLDPVFASQSVMKQVVGHGMWTGSIISTILGTRFPGPGTIYLGQTFRFMKPVFVGDTVTASVEVLSKNDEKGTVQLACRVVNQHGKTVLDGEASVLAPTAKHVGPLADAPRFRVLEPVDRLDDLLRLAKGMEPVRCAVVHPCDEGSLRGAILAAKAGMIHPVFVAPERRLRGLAEELQIDLSGYVVESVLHSHAAADRAAAMADFGEVEVLMKGSLHTDELIRAVLEKPSLRTKRRMSHVFRFDVPLYSKPLFITDAALNIEPTLMQKADIAQNAIGLAHMLGNSCPKVAILSTVETINPDIRSTIDAAALCKMLDRGQITGALMDGPLAFDNAISPEAVRIKGISSAVAGDSDILLVPDLESGNMLAKQLEYLAGASGSGIVLGARVPIALTSRADTAQTRMASGLLAQIVAHAYRTQRP